MKEMATPQNRLDKNVPAAAAASSSSSQDSCEGDTTIEQNPPPPPAPPQIRVCPHCKRQFVNGRAFGGHVRIHSKGGTKIRFTHKKGSISGGTTTTTHPQQQGEGASGDDEMDDQSLSVSLNGRGWHAARRMRDNSDDEVSNSNIPPKRNDLDLNMPPEDD